VKLIALLPIPTACSLAPEFPLSDSPEQPQNPSSVIFIFPYKPLIIIIFLQLNYPPTRNQLALVVKLLICLFHQFLY
jgi:hypothetical protein